MSMAGAMGLGVSMVVIGSSTKVAAKSMRQLERKPKKKKKCKGR